MTTNPREGLQLLTPIECKVLYWVCRGVRYREIGERLGYHEQTVQQHMTDIYIKFGLDRFDREERRARLLQRYCPILLNQVVDPDEDCEKLGVPKEKPVTFEEAGWMLAEEDDTDRTVPPPPEETYKEARIPGQSRWVLVGYVLGGLSVVLAIATMILVLSRVSQELAFPGLSTSTPTRVLGTPTILLPVDTPTLEAVTVVEASPTAIEVPSPTPIPSPTPSPTSTSTQTPTPIPTPTPLRDTPPGTVLNVGETWTQNGFQLTLKDVQRSDFFGEGTIHLYFAVKNRTGVQLSAALDAKNITVVDNNGNRFRLAECESYEQVAQINLDPGEYDEPLMCGRYYIVFRGDYFDPSVTEIIIRVTEWSRIQEAKWRIPIYH